MVETVSLVLALSLTPLFANASSKSDEAALRMLDSMNMGVVMDQTIKQVLALEIQNNPQIAPYKETLRKFFAKYLSYQATRNDLAEMYAEYFSAEELDKIAAFYSTSTGKKTLELMPVLFRKGVELGMRKVQEN